MKVELPGLESAADVAFDSFGVPTIEAASRLDAFLVLGYVTAADRLFQMDLSRRQAAGRVAEIFGADALEFDRVQRFYGFRGLASSIVAQLAPGQRAALESYAHGVNAFLAGAGPTPFECRLLGYRPEPWTPADSALIMLGWFQLLCGDSRDKRALMVMKQTLPAEVFAFLAAEDELYATMIDGGDDTALPSKPIPIAGLASLLAAHRGVGGIVEAGAPVIGSNAWAVAGAKTAAGGAILANDLHLELTVPNLLYRVRLRYGSIDLTGVMAPGIPGALAGSNGRVAWGMTRMSGDCLDLVPLITRPGNPDEYKALDRWLPFTQLPEEIGIKGQASVHQTVQSTIWGPVMPEPLLGHPVALRWTAFDPGAVDFGLLDLDGAATIEDAIGVAQRAGLPPLNVIVADSGGRIGWTLSGRFPKRFGSDGPAAQSWADGRSGWDGFIQAGQLPSVVDPSADLLVAANSYAAKAGYARELAINSDIGYRARRIARRLRELSKATPADMLELQIDTAADFYSFYRQLALEALAENPMAGRCDLEAAARSIAAWNGRADADSLGLAVLAGFREQLAQAVIGPLLGKCSEADLGFRYAWFNLETPLRRLLSERPPAALPSSEGYETWAAFIFTQFAQTVEQFAKVYAPAALGDLRWGELNRAGMVHALGSEKSLFSNLINMPDDPMPGCTHCIRVAQPGFGAAARLIVTPGREAEGMLHMPGGQSGDPFSPHYRDQHPYWRDGQALPLLPGPGVKWIVFEPGNSLDSGGRTDA